ncbi:helix-turn-helix transcriptional regulator [Chromobacterium sp. IIBBL 290-4]|uniref:ArsR/SmtB family transcription factor n=1 Tax=Chromobacterium sp. IIBBL 290-4 TaxID=2953890 RepID=UPI0020B76004|nr:helix-turn-helix transcriptional regulator [Chromobacterium sp. IIBBL 290-4]UTH76143.1 ArsR family transcriptional regulator [Chromobacterium sp. IIBBL 290-4]
MIATATLPDISRLASLLADPGRARMLLLMMDGRSYPASELAQHAGLSAQAASNHLAKLLQGGAVKVEQHGRHRYYLLANAAIAQALEALSAAAHGQDMQKPAASRQPAGWRRRCGWRAPAMTIWPASWASPSPTACKRAAGWR